ncbi:FkbM family methyltransferase [Methylobacterium sp. E-045]|nr:FkbM family methyltransferase [Methylobacterium sp. E-045]
MDAEGADLKVLQGFEDMLDAKKINFVQVEGATDPSNRVHIELQRFMAFMFKKGYGLYGLYDIHRDPKLKNEKIKNASCCNALFKISRPVEVADQGAEELEEQDV